MAAAASASAVVEESEPENSAAKRKKIDLAEAVEHEKAAAVEGVEHEKSAAVEGVEQGKAAVVEDAEQEKAAAVEGVEHEQSAAMEGVEHEEAAVVEGLEHEKSSAGDRISPGVFIEDYLKYKLPFRPGLIYYRNDEELARIRKILAEEHRIVCGEDSSSSSSSDDDCVSEDSDDMDDEYRRYKEQIDKSDGFDIDFVISESFWGAIYPIADLDDRRDYDGMVDTSVKFAIKNYNEQNQDHEKLELIEVEKANVMICAGYYFYITFKAKNIATSKVKTYQAQVDYVFGHEEEFQVPIFREKAET